MKQCNICLENIIKKDKYRTSCGHYFHFGCIKRWNLLKRNCPKCRSPMRHIIKCGKKDHHGVFTCKKCRRKSCFQCFLHTNKCPRC